MSEKVRFPFIVDTVEVGGTYYPEDSFVCQPFSGINKKIHAYSKSLIDMDLNYVDEFV